MSAQLPSCSWMRFKRSARRSRLYEAIILHHLHVSMELSLSGLPHLQSPGCDLHVSTCTTYVGACSIIFTALYLGVHKRYLGHSCAWKQRYAPLLLECMECSTRVPRNDHICCTCTHLSALGNEGEAARSRRSMSGSCCLAC